MPKKEYKINRIEPIEITDTPDIKWRKQNKYIVITINPEGIVAVETDLYDTTEEASGVVTNDQMVRVFVVPISMNLPVRENIPVRVID